MFKISVYMRNLQEINSIVAGSRKIGVKVKARDPAKTVDASRIDTLAMLVPGEIVLELDTDSLIKLGQFKNSLCSGQYIGKVVDIYEDSEEAKVIINKLAELGL